MVPLRRDSLSSQLYPQSMDEKESMSSMSQNSLFCSDSKGRGMRKEAIITNFMHKLDRE